RAAGDRVELTGSGAARRMQLVGQPAEVASTRGALQGETIQLDPASGNVTVPGRGRFVGNDLGSPSDTGTTNAGGTMTLAWDGSMHADGNAGICNIDGGIHLDGTGANGTTLSTA